MPYYSKRQQRKRGKAATKIQSLFRMAKQRPQRQKRTHYKTIRRNAYSNMEFYSPYSNFRDSSLMRARAAPRGSSMISVGTPRHISKVDRMHMFRRRAAADYKYYLYTKKKFGVGKKRDIYRGGAFYH